jgi:hypothetical protein
VKVYAYSHPGPRQVSQYAIIEAMDGTRGLRAKRAGSVGTNGRQGKGNDVVGFLDKIEAQARQPGKQQMGEHHGEDTPPDRR